MNNNFHFSGGNQERNDKNLKVIRRLMIVFAVFLLLNCILLLPPVHKKMELFFLSDMTHSGSLMNQGLSAEEAEEGDSGTVRGKLETCMVRTGQQDRTGNGVIWEIGDDRMLIVTAGHIVTEAEEPVQITFFNGKQQEADVIYSPEDADLAFLEIPMERFVNLEWSDYTFARRRDITDPGKTEESLQPEEDLILFDNRMQLIPAQVLNPSLYMEDFAQTMIWAEAKAEPGMSGSGVFDGTGRLAGILCGGNEQNEIAILPVSVICSEYDSQFVLQGEGG